MCVVYEVFIPYLGPKRNDDEVELSVRIGVSRSQILRKSTQEYLNFLENEYQRNNTQPV